MLLAAYSPTASCIIPHKTNSNNCDTSLLVSFCRWCKINSWFAQLPALHALRQPVVVTINDVNISLSWANTFHLWFASPVTIWPDTKLSESAVALIASATKSWLTKLTMLSCYYYQVAAVWPCLRSWYADTLPKIIRQGTVDGSRLRGRPRKSWKNNIKEWTGQSLSPFLNIADDISWWAGVCRSTRRRLSVTGIG